MAEYKSFHYLMHQVPENVKPVYLAAPTALPFKELYSPRERGDTSYGLIHKSEKSYWRTRDRLEFAIYEDRSNNVMIITCRNLDKREVYRTLFLDLEQLYFELEAKAQGHREKLTKKRDKKLPTDEILHKSAHEFILARLNIGAEALPWPDFSCTIKSIENNAGTNIILALEATPTEPSSTPHAETTATPQPTASAERMCTFSKLSSDVFETMEINKPAKLSLEGMEYVKLQPTAVSVSVVCVVYDTARTQSEAENYRTATVVNTAVPVTEATCSANAVTSASAPLKPIAKPSNAPRTTILAKAGTVKPTNVTPAAEKGPAVKGKVAPAPSTSVDIKTTTAAPDAPVDTIAAAADNATKKPSSSTTKQGLELKNNKIVPM